jgi:2-polyprenyl-6-methoxyphenol hydroxylase-like FAD-dependent oxidoreductase
LPSPLNHSTDVIVIGAGAAGVTAAAVLGQQGHRVLLLDPSSTCPPVFKAEKIERAQLEVLRQFGLIDPLLSASARSTEVHAAFDGRIFKTTATEQLGLPYATLVNALSDHLPRTVERRVARVESITPSASQPSVRLDDGQQLTARLVILACGISRPLQANLGLTRRIIQKEQSLALGFNIAPANALSFSFQSLTYYPTNSTDRIDYLTLFKVPNAMRANLFAFRSAAEPWVREFLQQPRLLLERCFPKLPNVIGEYRVTSRVESARVDLYRTDGNPHPGVVLIGDALQNVCPSTGLGLHKLFTDIEVLAECVPAWFASDGLTVSQISRFYRDPRKLSADAHSLANAFYHRYAATAATPRWRLHRALVRAKWRYTPAWKTAAVPSRALKRA